LFEPQRFAAKLNGLVGKLHKMHVNPSAHKRARQNAPAGICEYCHEPITGGFAAHNKVCSAREAEKGKHAAKIGAVPASPAPKKTRKKK